MKRKKRIMTNSAMRIRTKALAALAVVALMVSVLMIFSVRFSAAIHDDAIRMLREKAMILQYSMTIDFMEAVFGKETEIEIPKEEDM